MLRIAICDDEETARDALRLQLEKIIDEDTDEIIYEFSNGHTCANWIIHHPGEVDLLFLDIEMGKNSRIDNSINNGMDTARKIRENKSPLVIVFVTGYSDYVFDGYQVGALDYLTKPINPERLKEVILRTKKMLLSEKNYFILKNSEGLYRILYDDISYFSSSRRIINIVTEAKNYSFYGKLGDVEQQTGKNFVRIHQRYLINSNKVIFIGSNHVIITEANKFQEQLPISRAYKETASEQLAKSLLMS